MNPEKFEPKNLAGRHTQEGIEQLARMLEGKEQPLKPEEIENFPKLDKKDIQ